MVCFAMVGLLNDYVCYLHEKCIARFSLLTTLVTYSKSFLNTQKYSRCYKSANWL